MLFSKNTRKEVDTLSYLRILFEDHKDRIYKIAYFILKNEQDAKDVVQDTFITVFEKIDQLKDKDKFTAWITTIASNHAKSRHNKNKRELPVDHEDKTIPWIDPSTPFNIPKDLLIQKEFSAHLMEQINALPNQYREVIYLYYFVELSYEEISKFTGENLGTIKSRLFRGKRYPKDNLERQQKMMISEGRSEGHSHEKSRYAR
ncbi:RNA polymerase sigma factor [Anaerosolibacter sp.]|uniref:RNA polymerase sigma factor n=1 Tax=Anaerosolibacter sp. TaxID=1872527 RepID=UPI0039EE2BCA